MLRKDVPGCADQTPRGSTGSHGSLSESGVERASQPSRLGPRKTVGYSHLPTSLQHSQISPDGAELPHGNPD